MPYEWLPPTPDGTEARLHLWPYRSLPRRGFVWFIGGTAAMLTVPLLGFLGTPVLWMLLPFMATALAAVWFALQHSYRDGAVIEVLHITAARTFLARRDPRKPVLEWEAPTYWVAVQLYPTGGPVTDYLTLRGKGREVELGAFLTPAERKALAAELRIRLVALARA